MIDRCDAPVIGEPAKRTHARRRRVTVIARCVAPVRGVRGWIATTRPAPFRLGHPVEDHRDVWDRLLGNLRTTVADLAAGTPPPVHHAVLLQQDAAGRMVLGSSLMSATGDRDEGEEALAATATRAVRLVPALADVEVVETRSCARPTTPDGLPLHGPVPGVERLVLARARAYDFV